MLSYFYIDLLAFICCTFNGKTYIHTLGMDSNYLKKTFKDSGILTIPSAYETRDYREMKGVEERATLYKC